MLKFEDAKKTKEDLAEERDVWRRRAGAAEEHMKDLQAALQRILVEASLQGVRIGTSEASQVIAKRMVAGA